MKVFNHLKACWYLIRNPQILRFGLGYKRDTTLVGLGEADLILSIREDYLRSIGAQADAQKCKRSREWIEEASQAVKGMRLREDPENICTGLKLAITQLQAFESQIGDGMLGVSADTWKTSVHKYALKDGVIAAIEIIKNR